MDTFIPVFAALIGVMLVVLFYLACTAPLAVETRRGLHIIRTGDSAHNGRYTND